MKQIRILLFLCLPLFTFCSCSTSDSISPQILGTRTPVGDNLYFTPAHAYCSDEKGSSPKLPEKPQFEKIKLPSYDEEKVLKAESHGVKAENKNNYEAFGKLIAYCKKNSVTAIKLKEGTYYLSGGNVILSDLNNFVLDGNGAKLVIDQSKVEKDQGLLVIDKCSNLVLKNMSIAVSGSNDKEDSEPSSVVKVNSSKGLTFDSVKISSIPYTGFLFSGSEVKNVFMYKCGIASCETGIEILDAGGKFQINSCSFRNNSSDSIFIKGDSSDYLIRNSFFYHNKSNDLNVDVASVYITNCTFMHTGACPVIIGTNSKNVTIDESIFDGSNSSYLKEADSDAACISIRPSVSGEESTASRIMLAKNKLLNFPNYSLSLNSVDNVTLKGNLFINRTKYEPENKKRGGILLDKVTNTIVSKNLWEGKENLSAGIFFNPENTAIFSLEENLKE